MKFKVYILHCKLQLKPAQSVNFMALPHVWMVYEEKLHNRMNWSIEETGGGGIGARFMPENCLFTKKKK